MEENKKLTWKDKIKETKIYKLCKNHPDATLTFAGGILTIVGGLIKLACYNKEYEESIYITTQDDEIYKLPARPCKTSKKVKSKSIN